MSLLLLAMCAAALILAAVYLYLNPQVPDATSYRNVKLETPLRVLSKDGELLAEYGERRLIPIGMDKVPDLFVRALIDTEDKRFYSHQGVDLISLLNDSANLVLSGGKVSGGASTLTMQLARNVSFSLEQRFIRKFKEMLLALKIERELSKDEILNLYINLVPFGKRAYGAEAAAQTYYNRPLQELDLAQLAMLAGIPQKPSANNPINGPTNALKRRNLVLRRMLTEGSITDAEYSRAIEQPITARIRRQTFDTAAPYPAEIVRQELLEKYPDLYTAGYSVTTTIDSRLQQQAIAAVRRGLHEYDERHGYRGALSNIELDEQAAIVELLTPLDELIDKVIAADEDEPAEIPLPELPRLDDELTQRLTTAIEQQPLVGDQQSAVVVALSKRTMAVALADGSLAVLPWRALSWAAPFESVEKKGPAPQTVSDIANVGDVISVRTDPANPARLRLSEEPQVQGALVSLAPESGAIRALTGGYDFSVNQFNHAVQARRQPGSGFKPFVYSAALAHGITPASIYMDAPIVLEDEGLETQYRPDNNNKRYNGPTRLREALYRSINLVSIRVLLDVQAGRTLRHVAKFGFDTSNFPRNTQLGIGGGTMGVTPMDMARAYSVFANSGHLITPHLITDVRLDGELLETRTYPVVCADCTTEELAELHAQQTAQQETPDETPQATPIEPQLAQSDNSAAAQNEASEQQLFEPSDASYVVPRVLPKDNAWIMHTMLQDVIRRGTGRKALKLERSDLAGKTGTTNEAADTWFNGYNASLATTVWVGFSDYRPLGPKEFGSTTPLPIWIDYSREALRDLPSIRFDQPETVVSLKIDPQTGEIARPGQSNALFEYFLEDHQPEESLDFSPVVYESDDGSEREAIETTELF